MDMEPGIQDALLCMGCSFNSLFLFSPYMLTTCHKILLDILIVDGGMDGYMHKDSQLQRQ